MSRWHRVSQIGDNDACSSAKTRDSTFSDPVSCLSDSKDIEQIKEIREQPNTSIVPAASVEQKRNSPERDFEFRPLTEEEKKEFYESLDTDGKKILRELGEKAVRPHVKP